MKKTMKKAYMQPATDLVAHTAEHHILIGSPTLSSGGDNTQAGAPTTAETQGFRWEAAEEWNTEWGED